MIVYDSVESGLYQRYGVHASNLATWAVAAGVVDASPRVRQSAKPFAMLREHGAPYWDQLVIDVLTGSVSISKLGRSYAEEDIGEKYAERIAALRQRAAQLPDIRAIALADAAERLDEIRANVADQERYAAVTDAEMAAYLARRSSAEAAFGRRDARVARALPRHGRIG